MIFAKVIPFLETEKCSSSFYLFIFARMYFCDIPLFLMRIKFMYVMCNVEENV